MTARRLVPIVLPLLLLVGTASRPATASPQRGFLLEILVDGRPVREYRSHGTCYVEALKGRDYAIRLHNPLDVRVAVALAVDGLNTIDARHTTPAEARKWVLGPHETVTISGWQTSLHDARRFFFTSEERSYAARLGKVENLGVISAVFFRERIARVIPLGVMEREDRDSRKPEGEARHEPSPPTAADARGQGSAAAPSALAAPAPVEEYAATGMGDRTRHAVRHVHMDIEPHPVASVDIRYEYRPQLARLGVVPYREEGDGLARRERAQGFAGFCPLK